MKSIIIYTTILVFFCKKEDIIGTWKISSEHEFSIDYYPELNFYSDNSFIIKSYGDTIYSGEYKASKKRILLKSGIEKQKISILPLSKDTLKTYGFLYTKDTITYIRSSN